MKKPARRSTATRLLVGAIGKTEKVRDDLTDAARDLSDTNALLSGPLSAAQAVAAVAGAVKQNLAAEVKVQEAAEELATVKSMLEDAQVANAEEPATGKGGEGVASILPHLQSARDC
ncbi:hypothetical protein [Caenimonas aquaedulcis]|uniref:Uncharacterized protein n=1 Tax=Caenimonas aquaedulcis TaxID=2793270 RepID=A0A931MF92_9BURK|nr:hypothetical protein [Caenimonas aquaedulcis]MBG9387123.1 hypothetical protein [Caenimonas aquaedulcis]